LEFLVLLLPWYGDAPITLVANTSELPNAATLGGAYDGGGASPDGQQSQVIYCSG